MLRLPYVSLLILACVGAWAFKNEIWRPEEAVVLEEDVEKWLSGQELSFGKDFIVKARTVARDDWGKDGHAWMKIEYVFYGPAFLQGQQFRVVSSKENTEISGPFQVYPAPGLGDVGVWRLGIRKNRLFAFPRPISFGAPIPAFQKDADDYKTALAFAKTVEQVSQLPDRQKQLSRLKQLALSQDSEIACWATGTLANKKPDGIVDFLRSVIANEKSTVAAQAAADEALIWIDHKAWQHSEERIAMVKKWVHGKSSLRAALGSVGTVFTLRHEYFRIDKKKMLNFLGIALLNEEIPRDERLGILQGFGDYPKQFKDDEAFQDEIFQVVANVMLKSQDQAVKRKAAEVLVFGFSFESKKRQTKLRELMESEESAEGGRFLGEHSDMDAID